MIDWIVRRNVSEPGLPLSLVLSAVPPPVTATESVAALIYFQYADDPTMEPQFLVAGVAGKTVNVPFDLKGRDIILTMDSKTKDGKSAFADLKQAAKLYFAVPVQPVLVSAIFDSGDDEVDLVIANNGGAGDINIYRQKDTEEFVLLDSVAPATSTYTDTTLVFDGMYQYKLIQDDLIGESNTISVDVDVSTPSPGGTPPTDLSAFETFITGPPDEYDITLAWTAGSGSGDYTVERKTNFDGIWGVRTTSEATTGFIDSPVFAQSTGKTYYYRVKQNDVTGYAAEASVYIPRDGLGS